MHNDDQAPEALPAPQSALQAPTLDISAGDTERDALLHERVSLVLRLLEERETKAPPLYYRDDDEQEYCRACAEKHAPHEQWHGGAFHVESDSCVYCAVCGKLLSYVLTDYGAGEELDYFESNVWDWNNPDDCYHVARMLGCWTGSGAWKVEDLPDRDRVVKALRNGKHAPDSVAGYQE